jgi:diphosphomevalonate decarboxylase
MHAVMMTSDPPLIYWEPATIAVIRAVQDWRKSGIPVCFTIDAGPNVHVLTTSGYKDHLSSALGNIEGIQNILAATTGGAACLANTVAPA